VIWSGSPPASWSTALRAISHSQRRSAQRRYHDDHSSPARKATGWRGGGPGYGTSAFERSRAATRWRSPTVIRLLPWETPAHALDLCARAPGAALTGDGRVGLYAGFCPRRGGGRPSISTCRCRQVPAAYPQARAGRPRTPAQAGLSAGPLGLAPGGVYRATPVTRGAGGLLLHRFTLTAPYGTAVCFLWHCPAGHPGLPLTTTLPCGVRTFLGDLPSANRGADRRGRPTDSSVAPARIRRDAEAPRPAWTAMSFINAVLRRSLVSLRPKLQQRRLAPHALMRGAR
jgi:hypothetical protein